MSPYRDYDLNETQRVDVSFRLLAAMLANPNVNPLADGNLDLGALAKLAVEAAAELEWALDADVKRVRDLLEKRKR